MYVLRLNSIVRVIYTPIVKKIYFQEFDDKKLQLAKQRFSFNKKTHINNYINPLVGGYSRLWTFMITFHTLKC